jgi:hypothetical protein
MNQRDSYTSKQHSTAWLAVANVYFKTTLSCMALSCAASNRTPFMARSCTASASTQSAADVHKTCAPAGIHHYSTRVKCLGTHMNFEHVRRVEHSQPRRAGAGVHRGRRPLHPSLWLANRKRVVVVYFHCKARHRSPMPDAPPARRNTCPSRRYRAITPRNSHAQDVAIYVWTR